MPQFEAESVPELHSIAEADPSVPRRISAIVALGRAEGSASAQQALLLLEESGPDPETRRAAEIARDP